MARRWASWYPNSSVPVIRGRLRTLTSDHPTTPFARGRVSMGALHETDGICYENSKVSSAMITDGLSHTALASESILGQPNAAVGSDHDHQVEYRFLLSPPLTDGRCDGSRLWNVSDPRGFAWVNGEYRCTLYNHYLLPNSTTPDCMGVVVLGRPEQRYRPYGWRTARSRHVGGANLITADGSVQFISDDIDTFVWQGLSTRAGSESLD